MLASVGCGTNSSHAGEKARPWHPISRPRFGEAAQWSIRRWGSWSAPRVHAPRPCRQRAGARRGVCRCLRSASMSRAGDPQLHTHVVVVNLTRAEGRYAALDAHALYEQQCAAGVAAGDLSRERMQGIALATRRPKDDGVKASCWLDRARARAAEHGFGQPDGSSRTLVEINLYNLFRTAETEAAATACRWSKAQQGTYRRR